MRKILTLLLFYTIFMGCTAHNEAFFAGEIYKDDKGNYILYDCATESTYQVTEGVTADIEQKMKQYAQVKNRLFCTIAGEIIDSSSVRIIRFHDFQLTGLCRLPLNGVYIDGGDTLRLHGHYCYTLTRNRKRHTGRWYRTHVGMGQMIIGKQTIPLTINIGVASSTRNVIVSFRKEGRNYNFIKQY